MSLKNNIVATAALALMTSCSSGSEETRAPKTQMSEDVQLGTATVTLDGVTQNLDIWRTPCGLMRDNDSFVIWAGKYNPDNVQKSERNLNLGGDTSGQRQLSIEYMPDGFGSRTENVRIDGADTPEMTGRSFRWSGETISGLSLSIEAKCP